MFAWVEDCWKLEATPAPPPGVGATVGTVGTVGAGGVSVVVGLVGRVADSLGRGTALGGAPPASESSFQPSGAAEQPAATNAAATTEVTAAASCRRRPLGGEMVERVLGLRSLVTRRWSTELLWNLTQLPR